MISRERVYSSRFLAGQVTRYHVWPTITQQTVAAHSWRVACIIVEVFGLPRADVLYYALHHDSGELWAGDVPFTVKAKTPGLREAMNCAEDSGRRLLDLRLPELTTWELVQVKIADLLEMHEYGEMEVNLGNQYAEPVRLDTMLAAQKLAAEHCYSDLVNRWLTNRGSMR
jgi:5'-deoxynucleotidase YfbR-like HD superfamily hydrolase